MLILCGLYLMLTFGWLIQIISPGLTNTIFDVLLLSATFLTFLQRPYLFNYNFLNIFFIISYFTTGFVLSVIIRQANINDFLLVYKFLFYIVLLLPYSKVDFFDKPTLNRLLNYSFIMFLIVYIIKRMVFGDDRPTFFIENNFEIMFLCFLYYANYLANNSSSMLHMLLLILITFISGSRSGTLLALIVIAFSIDIKTIIRTKNIFLPFGAVIGAIGAYIVFSQRSSTGIESIDRYRFYQYFLQSVSEWTWWDFLTGADRISKLPDYVCSSLSFYQKLLSYEGDGTCYSVIFHSFNMRIIYDHGILITIAIITILFKVLSKFSIKVKLCVLLVLFVNGLSVSSLNSVYAALGIAIIASVARSTVNRH